MPFYDVYAERNYKDVMADTWGHLYPETQRKYNGYIYFTYTDYGDITVIKDDFEELSGPWYNEDMYDYVCKLTDKLKQGFVYKFVGTYIKFKNGNCRFSGKTSKIDLQ